MILKYGTHLLILSLKYLPTYSLNYSLIRMRSTKNAEKIGAKKLMTNIINSKTNEEFDDSDADIDLSDVKRFSEGTHLLTHLLTYSLTHILTN